MVENYKITEENASGCCPECNHSWDKGDVMDYVKESYPKFEEEDLLKIAKRDFGWTPENPRRFNHLLFIEASDGDYNFDGQSGYYQCPNCQIAWHSFTGQRTDMYKTMLDKHLAMDEFMKELMEKNKNK
jgi:hypothetical protein